MSIKSKKAAVIGMIASALSFLFNYVIPVTSGSAIYDSQTSWRNVLGVFLDPNTRAVIQLLSVVFFAIFGVAFMILQIRERRLSAFPPKTRPPAAAGVVIPPADINRLELLFDNDNPSHRFVQGDRVMYRVGIRSPLADAITVKLTIRDDRKKDQERVAAFNDRPLMWTHDRPPCQESRQFGVGESHTVDVVSYRDGNRHFAIYPADSIKPVDGGGVQFPIIPVSRYRIVLEAHGQLVAPCRREFVVKLERGKLKFIPVDQPTKS